MMKRNPIRAAFIVAIGAGCTAAISAVAQAPKSDPVANYPARPIHLIGQSAGSTADTLSRFVGQKLTERWGQPVIVENRPGAGGTIGTDAVAKSPPDGYTLVMGHVGTHASAPAVYPSLPYDPERDFAPITLVATLPIVLVVHPSLPVKNITELVTHAKQKPGTLNYSSAGSGTSSHLTGELFNVLTGAGLTHVPYKGAAPAMTAVLAGDVQVSFLSALSAAAQVKSGKVRAIAVSSRQRYAGAPDIPSAVEAGLPEFDSSVWFALFAPAKTPQPIVVRLNREVIDALGAPDVKEFLLKQGAEVSTTTPEELAAFLRSEISKWAKVVRESGAKAE